MSRPKKVEIIDLKPQELNQQLLPTNADVLLAIEYKKNSMKKSKERIDVKILINELATDILNIWEKATIPAIQASSVRIKLSTLCSQFNKLGSTEKKRKTTVNYKTKIDAFKVCMKKITANACSNINVRFCIQFFR